jgi:hypothetical protein
MTTPTATVVPARALLALWPVGVLVVLAHQVLVDVPYGVFLLLNTAYVAAAGALLVHFGAHRRGAVGALAATPVFLFGLVGLAGAPTGDEPNLYQANTAILLVVAVELVLAAVGLALRHRRSPAAGLAAATTVLLVLGSAGYLVNLLGRFAVVLTGLSDRQAALEDEYWVAAEYLRGLPENGDPLAYLLTWMDLVQLGYVVTAYVAAAGLARLLRTERVVAHRAGLVLERAAWTAAALLAGSIALAIALPRAHDAAPAALAFALSIPFMTTLLPFALAAGALWHTPVATAPGRTEEEVTR